MKPNKRLCGKWAVIRYYEGAYPDTSKPAPVSLVQFDDKDPEKFYWGEATQWAVITETTELVEVVKGAGYPYFWFMRKYHPAKEAPFSQSEGFLAPDGRWFPCEPGYSAYLAQCIGAQEYRFHDVSVRGLEAQGWLLIRKDGLSDRIKSATVPMLKALEKMQSVGDPTWNHRIAMLRADFLEMRE